MRRLRTSAEGGAGQNTVLMPIWSTVGSAAAIGRHSSFETAVFENPIYLDYSRYCLQIEQYLTYPVNAPVQDRFAEGLLLTLIEEGPKVLAQPKDYTIRANVMWAATMALNGLIGVGVPQDWATHMIGHELTAMHGLDHAQTLAVVLPAVMQHQRDKKRGKLVQYGQRVWGLTQTNEDELIDAAIAATRQFFEQMGTPTTLSGYGVGRDSIPKLVDMLVKHELLALGEHGAITPEASREILELAA